MYSCFGAAPQPTMSQSTSTTTTPLPIVSLDYNDFGGLDSLDYNNLGDYSTSPSSVSLNPESPQGSVLEAAFI
ncbi:MAG: hypothetical protein ACRCTK_04995 [Alphaproteobacteria bacterium]